MANTNSNTTPVYESPLAHIDTNVSHAAWKVHEAKDMGYVVVRGNLDNAPFATAIHKLCGSGLPERMQFTHADDGRMLVWVSPDEFLHILPLEKKDQFIKDATEALDDIFSAIVDNSGAYVKLAVSGKHHIDVLHKSAYYNLKADKFKIGSVYSTHLAKAPAILLREDEQSISLLVRFSFADYIWRLLSAGAKEYI